MRLSNIEVHGYGRFENATCNVDGKVIALIGPNEAGKSSLLRALEWLTSSDALPASAKNRINPPTDDEAIVRATYILDQDDLALIRALDIDPAQNLQKYVGKYRYSRWLDGGSRSDCIPVLTRNPIPFDTPARGLRAAQIALDQIDPEPEDEEFYDAFTDRLISLTRALDTKADGWSPEAENLRQLTDALSEVVSDANKPESADIRKVLLEAEAALGDMPRAILAAEKRDPRTAAREAVQARRPTFLLFKDTDRDLPSVIDLRSEEIPNGLQNLLLVGGTNADELLAAVDNGQSTMRSIERRVNKTLKERVAPFWSQSNLAPTVSLNATGVLEVNIEDSDGDGQVTEVRERSDGLRAFLGLVAFLLAREVDVPPVLLIDEAERNLHYDAQGDLVRLLTNGLPVRQVLYTTHSPGCLPLDLGTGIRVVRRRDDDPRQSTLDNNFWTDESPGFSRLLVAMGASAAAFSAFNKAILTEGVSEMMLLPTLLRKADSARTIDFQVAFGMSNMSIPNDLGAVALKTTYLVDGDSSGDDALALLESLGIPKSHRLQLPPGKALEDLLDRNFYLNAVDSITRESGRTVLVDRDALSTSHTIAKAVELQEKTVAGYKAPGHKIVAARIAAQPDEVRLSPDGRKALLQLWRQIDAAFGAPYVVGSD